MDFDFEACCDLDFSFIDENFGSAKNFTSAPIGLIDPKVSTSEKAESSVDREAEELANTEVKAEGFCFKLHPAENQVQF
jgi:hypothetical protein